MSRRAASLGSLALVLLVSCSVSTLLIDPKAAGTGRYSSAPAAPGWDEWPPPFMVAVMTHAQYEVTHYRHEVGPEGIPADSTSPTGFRLLPSPGGTSLERRSENIRGAGVILRRDGSECLILTCLHVVDFPPTVRTEISTTLTTTGRLLIGSALRKAQQTLIGRPGHGQVAARMVAYSEQDDLAILRADASLLSVLPTPIPYGIGQGSAIRPGDGLYILGSPRGLFQLTWGVATPHDDANFLVAAATPPGYSGGIVLATVRATGAFELVGIVTGTGGQRVKVWGYDDSILPGSHLDEVDPSSIVAEDFKSHDYGVTYCVKTERVQALLGRAGIRIQHPRELQVREVPLTPLE
ncbi:trypsin-like peptidase domain-containing protein [Candidatus Fermentibacteria bacterium]|nr:trypsin-like peptidase domain-containing protein [Candidatus Fermentibacteria bacterium]